MGKAPESGPSEGSEIPELMSPDPDKDPALKRETTLYDKGVQTVYFVCEIIVGFNTIVSIL
jgi:hypothetical protein